MCAIAGESARVLHRVGRKLVCIDWRGVKEGHTPKRRQQQSKQKALVLGE